MTARAVTTLRRGAIQPMRRWGERTSRRRRRHTRPTAGPCTKCRRWRDGNSLALRRTRRTTARGIRTACPFGENASFVHLLGNNHARVGNVVYIYIAIRSVTSQRTASGDIFRSGDRDTRDTFHRKCLYSDDPGLLTLSPPRRAWREVPTVVLVSLRSGHRIPREVPYSCADVPDQVSYVVVAS